MANDARTPLSVPVPVRPNPDTPAGWTFDEVVVPHLPAAHRLARWLMRNEHDAQDVVQEATLRALRYFRTFAGGSGRAWFLRIVRNTCVGWHRHAGYEAIEAFDEERHSAVRPDTDPEHLALRTDDARLIEQAMRNVPARFRELLVLRELKGLSYKELAEAMGMPIGTVMSGLSRGREAFRGALQDELRRAGGVDAPERAPAFGRRWRHSSKSAARKRREHVSGGHTATIVL